MIPAFKDQKYYKGIDQAVSQMIKLTEDLIYRDEFENTIEENKKQQISLFKKIGYGLFFTIISGVFIFFNSKFLLFPSFKRLVNSYRGLLTGKVSFLAFPFVFLSTLLSITFSLPFTVIPIVILFSGINAVFLENDMDAIFGIITNSEHFNFTTLFLILFVVLVFFPFIISVLTINRITKESFGFSFFKNNTQFISKNISAHGINFFESSSSDSGSDYRSSYSSNSSSSSSSSSSISFSGCGGSSSGGGASGSW